MADRRTILSRKRRLTACYKHLKKQKRVLSYADLAAVMGVPPVSVRVAFSKASNFVSANFISTFCGAYPFTFSEEWILSGEGEMLLPTGLAASVPFPERWQRVRHIMELEGLTYTKMSQTLGYPGNATIFRIVKQETRPQDETLERILTHFPKYNRDWLFNGRGEVMNLSLSQVKKEGDTVAFYNDFEEKAFPLISDPAAAGTLTNFSDYDPDEDERMVRIPVDRDYQGKYALFKVKGASMDDGTPFSLSDGDVVLARMIPQLYWQYKLHKNAWRYFIFVTRTEGIIIKSVTEHDTEKGILKLHSLNPDYADITLHMDDIQAIYNVIELTKRSLRW
ncbi:S24 family peptidase [Porphyromonas sp.]|uniref:S24 family peptidase n=1 Tax=Porphyromonas sp. TaxID=1924944 RepID=UPI0026DBD0E7|nr:S24 family peptidase [Porphyromonas sp.]MDO4695343.1 S24 family peptidase [Porphyromonas sp.]MDO4771127.1 S24 family peptidase [Porphyromonas sp.]